MARPVKQGIDYFPFDVDFFSDIKIRKIARACGSQATSILICLLCNIYKDNGYYILWDEDLPFVIADTVGVSEGAVKEVILKALQVDFFDQNIYKKYQVLTSYGIQKRFKSAVYKRESIVYIEEYMVPDVRNIVSDVKNQVTDVRSTQSKVNKSKVNKSKENKKEISPEGDTKKDELSLQPHPQVEHVDFVRLQEYFNTTFRGKLSMVVSMTESRRKAVKARIAQYDKETVFIVLKKVAASPFLLGCNDRNWKCDFDWIFKAANFTKILEGNYDEKGNTSSPIGRKESVSRLTDLAEAILTGSETT
jgi:hypothetical protein